MYWPVFYSILCLRLIKFYLEQPGEDVAFKWDLIVPMPVKKQTLNSLLICFSRYQKIQAD